ncbi:MAG TPA: hypothetical protein VNB64_12935, partial [Solirubrobacteraceae bacterium]|nr:hypothetical protein [Solirubrobacteraceae bacterium]
MTPGAGGTSLEQAPPALAGLLESLDRDGVAWSLLRPPASVAAPEGDVDVLVAPDRLAAVESRLAERDFVLMPMPGPDVHGVGYDREAGRFVWIHAQARLQVAGAVVEADEVLADTVVEEGLRRPGDGWLLWILLLRALVDKGELA